MESPSIVTVVSNALLIVLRTIALLPDSYNYRSFVQYTSFQVLVYLKRFATT